MDEDHGTFMPLDDLAARVAVPPLASFTSTDGMAWRGFLRRTAGVVRSAAFADGARGDLAAQ